MNNKETIWFFSEDTGFTLKEKRKSRRLIRHVIEKEGYKTGEINVIFCSDAYLHDINTKYLKHNILTDIITFDLGEDMKIIQGDIYISVERARENAEKYNVSLSKEIDRLMIHGILHLAGYKDKSPKDKQVMTMKEDYYLTLPAD